MTRFEKKDWLVVGGLLSGCILAYWHLSACGFINFDDNKYITQNPMVRNGITLSGIQWAFTAFHSQNWHPLTWISHMADCSLFGLRPAGHHWVNALFHFINCCLLYFLLKRMTGRSGRSAIVAALFAVHPLHVESVAWISERKDVLSTFFFFISLFAYISYARTRDRKSLFQVVLFFCLGLMCKPMVVTLPFVLLLLDFWPLNRFNAVPVRDVPKRPNLPKTKASRISEKHVVVAGPWVLLREKAVFVPFMLASCVITYMAQHQGGAIAGIAGVQTTLRVSNALVAYALYLCKLFWPAHLAVLYPFQWTIPNWQPMAATGVLLCITLLAISKRRSQPYLFFGWLWFVGTLLPVIGIVQVGAQAYADRYLYIPSVGIFIAAVWGVAGLCNSRSSRVIGLVAAITISIILAVLSFRQVARWKSNITLYRHTLSITGKNFIVEHNLCMAIVDSGYTLINRGKFREAVELLSMATHNFLGSEEIRFYCGLAHERSGAILEAMSNYRSAIALKPDYARAHVRLGILLFSTSPDSAESHFAAAVKADPQNAEAHNGLGCVLGMKGNTTDALAHFRTAVELNPDYRDARDNLQKAINQRSARSGVRQSDSATPVSR